MAKYANKSFTAAIVVCTLAATLATIGFTLIYILDNPSRLHWCKDPIVLDCECDNTTSQHHRYNSTYLLKYTVASCEINTTVSMYSDTPCEFSTGGYVISNGVVCYINPNCTLSPDKARSVLAIIIISALCALVAMLALVAILLFRFIPYLHTCNPHY